MNNFQFTQMGLNAGLSTGNPYVAAIGTVGGFFGDLSLGRKRKLEADRNLMNSISQDAYNAQVAANPNPYTQDGGYEQTMSFSRGGTVKRFYGDGGPVGHVIPAERAGKAVADAAKAGIDLQKPASKTGHQEGVIPGDGHPKADDRLMTPGGRPIQVSSGEVYVDDDTMRRMAEAVGIGIGSYAKLMYPDTKHGDGFADGGEVDPPKQKKAWERKIDFDSRYSPLDEFGKLDSAATRERYMDPEYRFLAGESLSGRPVHRLIGSRSNPGSYKGYQAAMDHLKNENPMQLSNDQVVKMAMNGLMPFGLTDIDQQRVLSINKKALVHHSNSDTVTAPVGFADGGPLQLPPEGIPPNWAPSNPYGTGQYASALYTDLVGQQLLAPERSFANFREKREPVPSRMAVRGMESTPLNPQLKGTSSPVPPASSPKSVGRSDGTEGMNKTNNIAFGANLALGTASLIYNAVQKGPVIPKPPKYEPEKVDLKTSALNAELDRRRTSGVATAGYALSNKQGLGRDLGLRSMDLAQRSQDAMTVENVENQERSANTQIENQARLYNNQSLQRWMERDQEAQMNFRREKGDRMSMSLAGISDATSGWASGNQQIGAMGQMNDFNDRYLRYLSGNSETMQWDGSTIYFGDGTSTKRVERGVKLYDPQDYKYISNRFIR